MNNVIIKAYKAKRKNPSSNLRLFVCCLLTMLCVPYVLADNTYTWTMASGDLGTNNTTNPAALCVPATSVTKGSPSTTWSAEWTWKDADNRYMGWDSNSRGIQIGKSNYGNGNQLVLSTSGISGTITNVTINSAVASSGAATITVSVGSATFQYNNTNSASVSSTTSANFAFIGNASGAITITLSSTADKAMFIKSITITYSTSSKTDILLPHQSRRKHSSIQSICLICQRSYFFCSYQVLNMTLDFISLQCGDVAKPSKHYLQPLG